MSKGVSHTERMRRFRIFLFNECGGNCLYCGIAMVLPVKNDKGKHQTRATATFDHIIPRSKGGGRYSKDNLVLCCYDCNAEKENHSLIEMMKLKLSGKKARKVRFARQQKFIAAQARAINQRARQEKLLEERRAALIGSQ